MLTKKLKKMGAWLLTFSLVLGTAQFSGVKAEEGNNANLALAATATADNFEAGTSYTAAKMNDGDESTRWASNQVSSAWVQLSWDTAQTIKTLYVLWERRTAQELSVEISDDGTNWTSVYDRTEIAKSIKDEISLEEPVTAKNVRLNIKSINATDPDTNLNWRSVSIWEFEAYEGERPDTRTEAEKLAESIEAPGQIAADAEKIPMPQNLPEGTDVRFYADYEQVVGQDGTIYKPLMDKTVRGFYEVTAGDGSSAATAEYDITIPGQYQNGESDNAKPAVIPELQEWYGGTGDFIAADSSRIIVGSDDLMDVAEAFAKDYKEITGMEAKIVSGKWTDTKVGDFYMALTSEDKGLGKEGYTLAVNHAVSVEAEEPVGAYWATRTILQVLKQTKGSMPKGLVRDYPKYEVRGFSLDVARKPISMDALYGFAKNMSWYKMNNLQVHLSDNLIFMEDYDTIEQAITETYAGFRLESGVVNEGTGKSATSEDLFYTKDEFRTFIQDSRTIGVSIVPELDMPAHALPFTRAFPEFMTVKTGTSQNARRHIIDELNLEKEGAYALAKQLWQDYFDGENPVFDEETIIHIGTDEFHGKSGQEGIEMFRRFSDEMIKFVQNTDRTVRMWGSLSNKRGTTPVAVDDVQLNVWNTGYSVPKDMHNLGYDMINTLDGSLYIVPSGTKSQGGYGDYLNKQHLYNNWQANNFGGYTMPAGDEQMLGACYAVWHDNIDTRANGISQYDSFDRFFDSLPAMSAKLWGDAKDRNFGDFTALVSEVGTAPDTNMYAELDFATNTAANWTFDAEITEDSSVNANDLTEVKNAEQTNGETGKAISLKGGESYAETPLDQVGSNAVITMKVKMDADANADGESEQILCESKESFGNIGTYALKASVKQTGKVGFSREGYTYSFNYELPKDAWTELEFHSGQDNVALYVNGELADDDPDFYYDNHPDVEMSEKKGNAKVNTMMVPIGRIGSKTDSFKGQIDYVKVTGSKTVSGDTVTSETLQEEIDRYADSLADSYTDASWQVFVKVRDEAAAVIGHTGSTAEDYTLAYEKLQSAAAKLEQKPEGYDQTVTDTNQITEDLIQMMEEAKEKLENSGLYTEESVAALEKAISDVKDTILENPNATIEDLSGILSALQNASKDLVEKPEITAKKELSGAITAAEALLKNTAGYTKASVEALQKAVADAKAVLSKENATVEELAEALTDLKGKQLIKDTGSSQNPSDQNSSQNPGDNSTQLKDGAEFTVKGIKYKVISAEALTVKLVKGKDLAKVKIDTVTAAEDGRKYKVVEIGSNAFKGCKRKLKTVTIGANVTTIGKNAFKDCKKLATVTIANKSKLKKVASGAFKGTSKKIKAKLPKNLKKNKTIKKQLNKAGIKKVQ